jgi:hypothetical protein
MLPWSDVVGREGDSTNGDRAADNNCHGQGQTAGTAHLEFLSLNIAMRTFVGADGIVAPLRVNQRATAHADNDPAKELTTVSDQLGDVVLTSLTVTMLIGRTPQVRRRLEPLSARRVGARVTLCHGA